MQTPLSMPKNVNKSCMNQTLDLCAESLFGLVVIHLRVLSRVCHICAVGKVCFHRLSYKIPGFFAEWEHTAIITCRTRGTSLTLAGRPLHLLRVLQMLMVGISILGKKNLYSVASCFRFDTSQFI